ncbi:NhaP-type Na+/H+ or K+/H+ antiporter [Haloarchaeobius iranensis]|uniref:NhaP-type Na+/H+ or K+/H+ antiporter n=1 Tax=Haloarchaeobius iranensis TaxID=996166 RepID=A0A1H0BFH1_9EURY|nr:NhaP-type Na+/H+ or K+/H+ antiporter [Haloarchaeobius iranensis]
MYYFSNIRTEISRLFYTVSCTVQAGALSVSTGTGLITLVVTILGLGVAAQVLADRLEIPSVLFLILAGILVGPEGLDIVGLEAFGGPEALSAIVGLSVAIIIFEGAFHLKLSKLRQTPREAFRLVTLGAGIVLLGTAITIRLALGASWELSFLIGALLIATGPTVITPILEVVPVRDRVAAALETEGIVNDVTAAILAVAIFEVVVGSGTQLQLLVTSFISRLGIGILVGFLTAGILWYLLNHVDLSPSNAVRNSRLIVLIGAIATYGIAEGIASEAGIAAVATAGILLGNVDMPYEDEIAAFKGDITLIVLSFVFISLATLLSFEDLLSLGLGGLVVIIAVVAVIRPVAVLLCTYGERFSFREQLFMGAVGPRGIIPASVATLFALELRSSNPETVTASSPDAATVLVGTVFLVILTTVVLQGGFARHIAQTLNVLPMRVIIVGAGRVGRGLAERLEDRGENVILIDKDQEQVEQARTLGFTVHHGEGADIDVLRSAGAENAKIVAAATGDDDSNLLVAQLTNSNFDVATVIARVNTPGNASAFEELGVRAIAADESIAQSMDNAIERPALSEWMTELGRTGDVQEIEVTAENLVGMQIGDLDTELPDGVLVALVSRDGDSQIPEPDLTLRRGDHLTFVGRRDAVHEAIERCHPELHG